MKELVVRIKMVLDHKKIGIIDLAIMLGYNSPQKIYRLFNTPGALPSCQIIEDLSNKFEDLNLNWLFTGKGTMYLPDVRETKENSEFRDKYYSCLEEKEKLYKEVLDLKK